MTDQPPVNVLWHFALSPFCRKVRLSLAEKRIEVKLTDERYWEKDADFLRRNPAGKVPVLRMGQRLMSDSAAICEYLEEVHPSPPLLPKGPEARLEVRRLVGWFDGKFNDEVTSKLVGERVFKKMTGGGYPDSANVKSGSKAVKFHLDYISDVDWNRSEVVKDWYAKIKSRPAFRGILADQVPGFLPPAHYADLDF